jgi:hypothetical protein
MRGTWYPGCTRWVFEEKRCTKRHIRSHQGWLATISKNRNTRHETLMAKPFFLEVPNDISQKGTCFGRVDSLSSGATYLGYLAARCAFEARFGL